MRLHQVHFLEKAPGCVNKLRTRLQRLRPPGIKRAAGEVAERLKVAVSKTVVG